MRLVFVFFVVMCTAASVFAGTNWIGFEAGKGEAAPQMNILSSSPDELILEVGFPGMSVSDVEKENTPYQVLSVIGGGKTANVGLPEMPTFSRFVAVAKGVIPQVEILDSRFKTLHGYNVYPAQEQTIDDARIPQPSFTKNAHFYSLDQLYPDGIAHMEGPKVIRGCAVSLLSFFPVQYNPAKSQLKVYSYIKVKVSFNGTVSVDPRYRSSYFEPLFQNLLLNYSSLGPSPIEGATDTTNGCDFLVITHANFKDWADSLSSWKNQSGISTRVRTTTQIGSDTGSIRQYIQNAYDTWNPPPSFVLLIGDVEFLPPFCTDHHPCPPDMPCDNSIGTDLYYSTVDGSDWFPDIYMGRISVDSASQAGVVVSKILDYQRNPISPTTGFYNKVLVAGYFWQGPTPGWEGVFYIKTTEVIRDFLVSKGYDVERCYTKDAGTNPCCYYYGDPLPPGLTWNGDSTQISNAINNGVFLVNHRDHGEQDMWMNPRYTVSHVNGLANGDNLPVVVSMNCLSGKFDDESKVCFCEALQRNPNGGAVGVFGHTRTSYTYPNDELCKGIYDAIWPDFDPDYPNGGSTHPIYDPLLRMGAVLNFAKFYMYDKYYLTGGYGYPNGCSLPEIRAQFEMFHYFGDPTMQICTEPPNQIPFAEPIDYLTPQWPICIFAANLDRDGYKDLAVSKTYGGTGPNGLSVLRNDGYGGFMPVENYQSNSTFISVSGADFDLDGDMDLVAADYDSNRVTIYENDSLGNFNASPSHYAVGHNPISVTTAYLNQDLYPDLAVANQGSHSISILLNNGDGGFLPRVDYFPQQYSYPNYVIAADLDKDGDQDLAVSHESYNNISILKNNGSGVFPFGDYGYYDTGDRPVSIFASDLDGDTNLDLVVATTPGSISILRNDGNGIFQLADQHITLEYVPTSVSSADFDGDGDKDIVVSACADNGKLFFFTNLGNGTFVRIRPVRIGDYPSCVITTDLDEDGDNDIAVANMVSGSISILENLNNNPPLSYTPGDASGDGLVDLGDVVYLINYLYKGGVRPASMKAADPNADCLVDVGDVVHLISYLYKSGSAPAQGCAK